MLSLRMKGLHEQMMNADTFEMTVGETRVNKKRFAFPPIFLYLLSI